MLRWDIILRIAAESIMTFGRTFVEAWAHVSRSGAANSLAVGLTPNKKLAVQVCFLTSSLLNSTQQGKYENTWLRGAFLSYKVQRSLHTLNQSQQ